MSGIIRQITLVVVFGLFVTGPTCRCSRASVTVSSTEGAQENSLQATSAQGRATHSTPRR